MLTLNGLVPSLKTKAAEVVDRVLDYVEHIATLALLILIYVGGISLVPLLLFALLVDSARVIAVVGIVYASLGILAVWFLILVEIARGIRRKR